MTFDNAPPPLALFVAGLTGCIMTQIRAFAKRMDVPIDSPAPFEKERGWSIRHIGAGNRTNHRIRTADGYADV